MQIEGYCSKATVLAQWLNGEETSCKWQVSLAVVFFSAQISKRERRLRGTCCWTEWALKGQQVKYGKKDLRRWCRALCEFLRVHTVQWKWHDNKERKNNRENRGSMMSITVALLFYQGRKQEPGPDRAACYKGGEKCETRVLKACREAMIKLWVLHQQLMGIRVLQASDACSSAAPLFIPVHLFLFCLLPYPRRL